MIIIPAIDLKDGRCVRLRQGRSDDATTYADDPVAMAIQWAEQGADYLHVVDLDGAFQGRPAHLPVIARIADAIDIPVEVGGGLRSDEHIQQLLDTGVERAIIGTRALEDPQALARLVKQFGAQVVVGIDAKNGLVQVRGWVETSDVKAVDLAEQVCDLGVNTIIVTDTTTDGMMEGTNADAVGSICERVSCSVIASGGITTVDDVQALIALKQDNLTGAIVGKALYEETVTLKALMDATRG